VRINQDAATMLALYEPSAPKNPTNLSINSDLLKKARELDINLSTTLESALVIQLKARQTQLWLEQNKNTTEAYSQSVDANGVFSDGLRSF
jgi:antitoxin CcdA